MKKFSVNDKGKFIGLFNHKSNIFIQEAALRHQAYENFLYGEDDEIENALAELENYIAKLFYYWTEEKLLYPPPAESNGFKLLKRFILYQAYRTPKSGGELLQSINEGLDTVLKEVRPDLWQQLVGSTLRHENPVLLGLVSSIEHESLLNFLDCKFIVNLSELPLLTSDAPVVFYNQLMEASGNYLGATGLATKGLQIFYPIHPRLIICLYDSDAYDLGSGFANCSSTESVLDIHQLNALQYINSKEQLFFNDLISEEYIKELCKQYDRYRKVSKHVSKVVNSGSGKFFVSGTLDAQINLNLDFFKTKVNPKDFENQVSPLRHPSFARTKSRKISFDD